MSLLWWPARTWHQVLGLDDVVRCVVEKFQCAIVLGAVARVRCREALRVQSFDLFLERCDLLFLCKRNFLAWNVSARKYLPPSPWEPPARKPQS
jgi:hypothetical protein